MIEILRSTQILRRNLTQTKLLDQTSNYLCAAIHVGYSMLQILCSYFCDFTSFHYLTTVANHFGEHIFDLFTRNGHGYNNKRTWQNAQPKKTGGLLSKNGKIPEIHGACIRNSIF